MIKVKTSFGLKKIEISYPVVLGMFYKTSSRFLLNQ